MGSEYFINSQELEDKIRQLLPSQGGAGAGFDLSASTQIIPIIDVTPSAEGSQLRVDLQSALSFNDVTSFEVQNANTTIINSTGFWRIVGTNSFNGTGRVLFNLFDSAPTQKIINDFQNQQTTTLNIVPFDFNLFLASGDVFKIQSFTANAVCRVSIKQIADITGVLTTPS